MYEYKAVRRINKRTDYTFLHSCTLTYTNNCTILCDVDGGVSCNLFRCATL